MSDPPSPLDPQKLAIDDAARLLTRVGGRPVSKDTIQADVERGAPNNSDGTINLVMYAAWLVRQLAEGN